MTTRLKIGSSRNSHKKGNFSHFGTVHCKKKKKERKKKCTIYNKNTDSQSANHPLKSTLYCKNVQ